MGSARAKSISATKAGSTSGGYVAHLTLLRCRSSASEQVPSSGSTRRMLTDARHPAAALRPAPHLVIMGMWSLGDGATRPKPPGPPTASPRPTSYGFLTSNRTKHTPKREQAMKSQHDHGSTAGGAWQNNSENPGPADQTPAWSSTGPPTCDRPPDRPCSSRPAPRTTSATSAGRAARLAAAPAPAPAARNHIHPRKLPSLQEPRTSEVPPGSKDRWWRCGPLSTVHEDS